MQDFAHNDDLSNLDSSSIADTNPDIPSVAAPAPVSVPAPAPKTPAKDDKEKKPTPNKSKDTIDEQPPSPVAAKKQPSRKTTMEVKAAPSPVAEKTPAKTESVSKSTPLPPIRYAAAAAAAVAPSTLASAPTPSSAELKSKPDLASPPVSSEHATGDESSLQSNVRSYLRSLS